MHEIIDLQNVLSNLGKLESPTYFLDFMRNDSFEVGVLRLMPGQKDTQDIHTEDELYFVVQGSGKIRISHTDNDIKNGNCIFVPSNTNHFFHSNNEELIVLYIFNSSS